LNSDDYYFPGIFDKIARKLDPQKKQIIFSNCEYYNEKEEKRWQSDVVSKYKSFRLPFDYNFIIQPSTFWTKELWKTTGPLNENYHYGFDWAWILRASKYCEFISDRNVVSVYRLHSEQKTQSGGKIRSDELLEILSTHGYEDYSSVIKKLIPHKKIISNIVESSTKYHTRRILFVIMKLLFPTMLSRYSIKEIGEIINKVIYLF